MPVAGRTFNGFVDLRLLRCDEIQGYLMARPQSAEDVGKLLGHQFEIPRPNKT